MKALFIIPPTDLTKSYGQLKDFSNPQPSVGVAYIGAALLKNGYDVKVIDAYVNGYGLSQIMQEIGQYAPDVVGISALTSSAEVVYEISKNIRKEFPGIKIVMGNLHATLFCDEVLSANFADFVVHGEGELTMLELLNALEGRISIKDVKGISFKTAGAIVNNPARPHIEDLDSLPFPAWNLFPKEMYSTDPRTEIKEGVVETMILATRGCPNECTFCSSHTEKSLGSKYRMRSPRSVVDEMVFMSDKYGSDVFSFMDLAFPLVRKHAMAICDEIISKGHGKKFKWVTECRVKPLDTALLSNMKKAGCVRLCFGIESGSDDTLKALKKNFTVDDVRKAVKMAREAGIEVDGMFMIGLPGETEDKIRQTIDFAIELNVRYAIFNLFVPYPGCELYDILKKTGKLHFNKWSDFTSYPTYSGGVPVYVPDGLTHNDMMRLQTYAMKKFYLRPRFIYDELRRMKPSQMKKYYNGLKALLPGMRRKEDAVR